MQFFSSVPVTDTCFTDGYSDRTEGLLLQILPPLPSPLKPGEAVPRPLYLSVCHLILFPSPRKNLAPVCQRRQRSVFFCIDRGTKLTVFTHRLQSEFAEREKFPLLLSSLLLLLSSQLLLLFGTGTWFFPDTPIPVTGSVRCVAQC